MDTSPYRAPIIYNPITREFSLEYKIESSQLYGIKEGVNRYTLDETSLFDILRPNDGSTHDVRLPHNVVFYFKSGEYYYYVVEMKPGRYPIFRYINEYTETTPKYAPKYAMPWQYFVLQFHNYPKNSYSMEDAFDGLSLFWSRRRVTSIHDNVLTYARILNCYSSSGNICMGDSIPDSKLPLHEKVDSIVENFYSESSIFNYEVDSPEGYSEYDRWVIPYNSFSKWLKESRRNPFVWKEWDILRSGLASISNYFEVSPSSYGSFLDIFLGHSRAKFIPAEEPPVESFEEEVIETTTLREEPVILTDPTLTPSYEEEF